MEEELQPPTPTAICSTPLTVPRLHPSVAHLPHDPQKHHITRVCLTNTLENIKVLFSF